MATNTYKKTPLLDSIGEEFAKKVISAACQLEDLRYAFYDEDEPDNEEYRNRYNDELGGFFEGLRFPALCVPVDAVLVSIGDYDFEDYWGCSTYNFLVDKRDADGFVKAGEAALKERFGDADFYEEVIDIDREDFVRMKMFVYAIERGLPVYREFCTGYDDRKAPKKNLYEEFVDQRCC